MNAAEALTALFDGKKIRRAGWTGSHKDRYWVLYRDFRGATGIDVYKDDECVGTATQSFSILLKYDDWVVVEDVADSKNDDGKPKRDPWYGSANGPYN